MRFATPRRCNNNRTLVPLPVTAIVRPLEFFTLPAASEKSKISGLLSEPKRSEEPRLTGSLLPKVSHSQRSETGEKKIITQNITTRARRRRASRNSAGGFRSRTGTRSVSRRCCLVGFFLHDTRSSSKTNPSERLSFLIYLRMSGRGGLAEERGGAPPRRINPSPCLRASIREATLHVLLISTSQSCRAQMEGCWEINNGRMMVAALTEEVEEDKPAERHKSLSWLLLIDRTV